MQQRYRSWGVHGAAIQKESNPIDGITRIFPLPDAIYLMNVKEPENIALPGLFLIKAIRAGLWINRPPLYFNLIFIRFPLCKAVYYVSLSRFVQVYFSLEIRLYIESILESHINFFAFIGWKYKYMFSCDENRYSMNIHHYIFSVFLVALKIF